MELRNTGIVASLADKLTLFNADGSRMYFSDNYVSLQPGESQEIKIEYPVKSGNGRAQLAIRGWNLSSQIVQVALSGSFRADGRICCTLRFGSQHLRLNVPLQCSERWDR